VPPLAVNTTLSQPAKFPEITGESTASTTIVFDVFQEEHAVTPSESVKWIIYVAACVNGYPF